MKTKNLVLAITILAIASACNGNSTQRPVIQLPQQGNEEETQGGGDGAQTSKNNLPAWEKGYLDIHFINTTTGESVFLIYPDGTQMLIDAASAQTGEATEIRKRWNPSERGSQIIGRYIENCMKWTGNDKIDYAILTHYHGDHMGTTDSSNPMSAKGNYRLNGMAEILDNFTVSKMVDRDYPSYSYPTPGAGLLAGENFLNYRRCIAQREKDGGKMEKFDVGSTTQFEPVYDKTSYSLTVRNISGNGVFWTGSGNSTEMRFPEQKDVQGTGASTDNCPCENSLSCTVKLSYGDFDVFLGGDTSVNGKSYFSWKDSETPISKVVGPVEVMKANHHGSSDANYEEILKALKPQVIVVNTWQDVQPKGWDKYLYSQDAVYPITNLAESTKTAFKSGQEKIWCEYGHVVVRVSPGGKKYCVYNIDDQTDDFKILKTSGYACK